MKINQLKAGVILSYVSEGVAILSNLIYMPIVLRLLGQGEYGLYQLSVSTTAYLSLLSLGFSGAYIRYYSKYKVNHDETAIKNLNGMFMAIFIFLSVICALAGTVLVCNVDRIFHQSLSESERASTKILMGFMVFNMAISFPGSVFISHITANEQYVFQKMVNIVKNLLTPFITLPFLLLGYKSVAVVILQTILSILAFGANMFFCLKKLKMSFHFKHFDFVILKELFSFSFFIFLNNLIDQVNWNVDNFVLGIFKGTVSVAVYGVAAQLNTMYLTSSLSVSNVFAPRINRIVFENNDNKELTRLFTRVGRIQFVILMLILYGFIIFGREFIAMWAGKEYYESYWIALLLLMSSTIPLFQNLGIEIQRAKNMHRFRSVVYFIMAIFNVCFSVLVVKKYGGVGVALGTAFSILIGNGLIMNIYYHKKIGLDMKYFWKNILSFIPALLVPTLVGILIMKYINFTHIIVYGSVITLFIIVYCASIWCLGLKKQEKELIRKPLGVLRRKI